MSIEIVGIVATLFILVSFLMNSERKIRMINIVGAVIFVVYGVAIGAASVWLLNAALILIHVWKLVPHKTKKAVTVEPEVMLGSKLAS